MRLISETPCEMAPREGWPSASTTTSFSVSGGRIWPPHNPDSVQPGMVGCIRPYPFTPTSISFVGGGPILGRLYLVSPASCLAALFRPHPPFQGAVEYHAFPHLWWALSLEGELGLMIRRGCDPHCCIMAFSRRLWRHWCRATSPDFSFKFRSF